MKYELIRVVGLEGDLEHVEMGYVIKATDSPKLRNTTIYDDYIEARKDLDQLNEAGLLRQHWPMPTDPEVQALVDDPKFDPVEFEMIEVIDVEKSHIVRDALSETYNEPSESGINWMDSEVVYKLESQPKRAQGKSRIDTACEKIARERMATDV